MGLSPHRHDISDRVWERIREHLPGGPGKIGRGPVMIIGVLLMLYYGS